MKHIISDTSSVTMYHLYQETINKLSVDDKLFLSLKTKPNGYQDIFVHSTHGELGEFFSEDTGRIKQYFNNPNYVTDAFVKKIIERQDGMKSVVVQYSIYETDTPQQSGQQPRQSQVKSVPPKKKDKKGCFALIVLGFLMLVFWFSWRSCSAPENPAAANMVKDSAAIAADPTSKSTKPLQDSAKIQELKGFFNVKKDEFNDRSWIQPKARPVYTNNNGFYCYFEEDQSGKVSNLRFRGQYVADDWLFIWYIEFNVDGENFKYHPSKVERDNGDGLIWEWFDEYVEIDELILLKAISEAKTVKVRFHGDQYYDDKTISANHIKSIKRTLEYYQAKGGKL